MTEANVASLVWHSLLTVDSDARYVPQLAAEPIPTTANGGLTLGQGGDAMTVTWRIRDGLRWSDGQPLTCDDFKYAWEWVLTAGNVATTTGFEDITSFECAFATDMTWHFGRVYEGYLTLITAPLPRHALASIPIADQVKGAGFRPDEVARMPVSGPFRIESVTPLGALRLARNDNFVNPATGRAPYLDSIVFKWYADADAMSGSRPWPPGRWSVAGSQSPRQPMRCRCSPSAPLLLIAKPARIPTTIGDGFRPFSEQQEYQLAQWVAVRERNGNRV